MAKRASRDKKDYALAGRDEGKTFPAPRLPYRPGRPRVFKPKIGLIGCGGITDTHLQAYRKARYPVVAFCDLDRTLAERRRDEHFPKADVIDDYREMLARDDINVIDAATHPAPREQIVLDAIRAGKHVLSQKPFVLDLKTGRRLIAAAKRKRVCLAVNQNGRWAPHFSYMQRAVSAGLIGDIVSIDIDIHWDHNWVAGTAFDEIDDLILYDFAIHWFDIVNCFMNGAKARRVVAVKKKVVAQSARPALWADAIVEYPKAIASLVFGGSTRFGAMDRTVIVGTDGTLVSSGPNLNEQTVTLHTKRGTASPKLTGCWFPDGFDGTMSELLCAVDEGREPTNSAASNLESLAVTFAAIESARTGDAIKPGSVKSLPKSD